MAFNFETFGEEQTPENEPIIVDGKFNFAKFGTQTQEEKGTSGLGGFVKGVGKSALGSILGAGRIGQDILQQSIVGRSVSAITGQDIQKMGSPIYEKGTKEFEKAQELTEARTPSEKFGKFAGDVGQFVAGSVATGGLTSGAGIVGKIITNMATSGAIASMQEGEVGKDAAIAAGTEAVFPIAGKVIKPITKYATKATSSVMKRLLGGLGANVDAIADNPEAISKAIEKLSGADKKVVNEVLENNAKKLQSGFRSFRQQIRKTYGEGLEQLSKQDISPTKFRQSISNTLDNAGSVIKNGKRVLQNVEFDSPKNIQKADELISKLSKAKLDGKSLRKLADDILDSKYKTALSDERLSFNAFVDDLSKGVRKAIDLSTDKLKTINKDFSSDMQLLEAMEDLIGKQKFFNTKELQKIANKLPNILEKSGLPEKNINNFLTKIGIEPTAFRAEEAVRKAVGDTAKVESAGLGLGELRRQITAGIINPETATRFAVFLEKLPTNQLSKVSKVINSATEKTKPIVIKALIDLFED